jgi:hypothetical protein
MKRLAFITILILFIVSGCKQSRSDDYQVSISRNAETLFIIYSIADFGITTLDESFSKTASEEFNDYKDHNAVRLVEQFAKNHGIDALPKFIRHFSELPDFQLIYPFDADCESHKWATKYDDLDMVTQGLATALIDFYTEAKVEDFIRKNEAIYSKTISDVYKHLPTNNLISSMEQYYGIEHKAYVLIPSPTLFPSWGFGGSIQDGDKKIVYNTFGPQRVVRKGGKRVIDFNSPDKIRNISVHEFGHSFVNPIADKPENRELINRYSHLFDPIKDELTKQAYTNWWVCVVEHLVRLGEIRISEAMGNRANAKMLRHDYTTNRSFIYLPLLERKIVEYESNRDKYPTFEDFIPELLSVFAEVSGNKSITLCMTSGSRNGY